MEEFTRNDQRAIVAEFLGTMFFVMLGTGAVVAAAVVASDGASVITAVAAFWLFWKNFGDDHLEGEPPKPAPM